MPADRQELRKRADRTLASMREVKDRWRALWVDLRDYMLPRRGRALEGRGADEVDDGDKKHRKLYTDAHLRDVKNLGAGMHSGLTSPARPWFKLGFGESELDDDDDVRAWTFECEDRLRAVFAASNLYNTLPQIYEEFGTFGTALMTVTEDRETVIRCRGFTIGEFAISTGADGRVNRMSRTLFWTAEQLVEEFGQNGVPNRILEAYKRGDVKTRYELHQLVEPRSEENDVPELRGRDYASMWFLAAKESQYDTFLRISGFNEKAFMALRWSVVGEDVYGESAGMDVLDDVKMLQAMEKTAIAMLNKAVNPPVVAPGEMKGSQINTKPGGVTYTDAIDDGLRPLYHVQPDIRAMEEKIQRVLMNVKEGLFADLFRMLHFTDNSRMTATEVAERQQEKLLLLGPVLERVYSDLLDPLIDRTFGIMLRNGLLPDPPEAIRGREMRITYVSILAQAQKLAGITAIEQLAGFVGNLAGVDQSVLDKMNFDELINDYADRLGVDPRLLNDDEVVANIREARAQAMAQQQQMEMMGQAAQGAKLLSEADANVGGALMPR